MVHNVHSQMTVTFEDWEESVRKHNGRVKYKFQVRNAQTILNGVDTHLDFSAGTSTARGDNKSLRKIRPPTRFVMQLILKKNIDRSVAILLPLRDKGNTVPMPNTTRWTLSSTHQGARLR
jgi:hypothetical protein